MKRVLFVDDEPKILDGLRRTLRPLRKEWDMVFVASGAEAIEETGKEPFQLVVTDMRMPGMDGAELLAWFHDNHPRTIRFALSGHAEAEGVMRAVPIAHQFMSKPCDAKQLREVVTRAFDLQELLGDSRTQSLVGTMSGLPSRPTTYTAVLQAIADPEVELAQIAQIIESDVAMSAKVLQLVNSAFFGMQQNMADIGRATNFLGLNTIRDLVLSVEVFRPPSNCAKEVEAFLEALQMRSIWTGAVAKKMFEDKRSSELAFTAGVLHDIGMLMLATRLPEQYSTVLKEAGETLRPLSEIEIEIFGVSHEAIGAYLLGVWGLPYPILETAAYHDRPARIEQTGFSELAAVHVASALVETSLAESGAPFAWGRAVDSDYLESLGVADRLPEWESIVARDAAQGGDPE